MPDILVIRVNAFCRQKELNDIYRWVASQKETGTVVLPHYCEALVVPEDIEIRVEDLSGEFVKGDY